ncbi:MAG TPA: hypothetical protein VGK64_14950 [Bryobacteraceae bacterium]
MPATLAALGWIGEDRPGNRLRWNAPLMELVDGAYRGLPVTAIVERADVTGPLFHPETFGAIDILGVAFPANWFESEITPFHTPLALPSRYIFPKRVQLATFVYQGPGTRMRVLDAPAGITVRERTVSDGEAVWIKEPFIGELQFFSGPATLLNLRFVDFYDDHGLLFEPIARIAVARTAGQTMDWPYQRYSGSPTLNASDWTTFNDLLAAAFASSPDNDRDSLPFWREFETILGARWEYSVAAGFGFRDGPIPAPGAPADDIETGMLLSGPGAPAHAYRVTLEYPHDFTVMTNVMVVPASVVPPLQAPAQLGHEDSVVRLFGASRYVLSTNVVWSVLDPHSIGIEAEHEIGASPILGGLPVIDQFSFRSRGMNDSAERTVLPRQFDVPFYDVPLRIRARSADGWDRVSPFGAWTPWDKPFFDHAPDPPPLLQARHRNGKVELIRGTGTREVPDWTPDHAVANTPGSKIEILRRIAQPAAVAVNVEAPRQVDQWRYEVDINGVPGLDKFRGGRLIAGRMRATITAVDNTTIQFTVTGDGTFAAELYESGPAILHQDPHHPSLFLAVGNVPAVDLPLLFSAADPLLSVGESAEVIVYAVRVRFGTIVGPVGNPVSALRQPEVPFAPPPFNARVLGLDFYERTVVQLIFTAALDPGDYAVSFAEGIFDASTFDGEAVPGTYDVQGPHNGTLLYETLTLPLPGVAAKSFTLGVQRLLSGGARSAFVLGTLTVPPLGE